MYIQQVVEVGPSGFRVRRERQRAQKLRALNLRLCWRDVCSGRADVRNLWAMSLVPVGGAHQLSSSSLAAASVKHCAGVSIPWWSGADPAFDHYHFYVQREDAPVPDSLLPMGRSAGEGTSDAGPAIRRCWERATLQLSTCGTPWSRKTAVAAQAWTGALAPGNSTTARWRRPPGTRVIRGCHVVRHVGSLAVVQGVSQTSAGGIWAVRPVA